MTHTPSISIIPTTDFTLPWVDYSTLTAINTCPRWGMIHAVHGKRFMSNARAMPLEAGSAMHQVFAAVRMFDLLEHLRTKHDAIPLDVIEYGAKLFRSVEYDKRWSEALQVYNTTEDATTRCMQFALHILETSGFHDDPDDRRRTQTNLETAAIQYIDRYPLGRYIPIYKQANVLIGIEVPIDVTIVIDGVATVRFVGRVDGLCTDTTRPSDPLPEVHENKTGSRIDTVWSSSFDVSHQVTGYLVALNAMLGQKLRNCVIWGTQLPVPKTSLYGDGSSRYPVSRDETAFQEWAAWVCDTLAVMQRWQNAPTDAPMYTHSCSRYFRSCSLIPLCVETREQRRHIFDNEMVTQRWNPLADEGDVA